MQERRQPARRTTRVLQRGLWSIALLRSRMPVRDIRAVLWSDRPAPVHALFEIHGERIEERLTQWRSMLASIERRLAGGPAGPRDRDASSLTVGGRAR